MKVGAHQMKIALPAKTAIDADVDLCADESGYWVKTRLNFSAPSLKRGVARSLLDGAVQLACLNRGIDVISRPGQTTHVI